MQETSMMVNFCDDFSARKPIWSFDKTCLSPWRYPCYHWWFPVNSVKFWRTSTLMEQLRATIYFSVRVYSHNEFKRKFTIFFLVSFLRYLNNFKNCFSILNLKIQETMRFISIWFSEYFKHSMNVWSIFPLLILYFSFVRKNHTQQISACSKSTVETVE